MSTSRVVAARLVLVLACPSLAAGAAVQDAERSAKSVYARAVALEAKGDHTGALSLLWEAAALAPRDAEIQNRLGEGLDRIGALDGAIDAYRAALAAQPGFRKASNNLILVLVKAGRGEEAVARAKALVAEAPDDADRHFTLGLAESEYDITAAMGSFRRALELSPRHALARYNLALVLRRADRLDEAIVELNRALAVEARPEMRYSLGIIYWHQGDLDRAEQALDAAIATEPRYFDAQYNLGSVLKAKRDLKGAASALRRAIALRPDLPAPHYTLAQVLELQGDPRGAAREIEEADRLRQRAEREREAVVLTAVGSERLRTGDVQGALTEFRRATEVCDDYAPAHYQLGLILERLGQTEAASAAFARAARLNPILIRR
jgi:tetratricopeptide (TPR) repeat protein